MKPVFHCGESVVAIDDILDFRGRRLVAKGEVGEVLLDTNEQTIHVPIRLDRLRNMRWVPPRLLRKVNDTMGICACYGDADCDQVRLSTLTYDSDTKMWLCDGCTEMLKR